MNGRIQSSLQRQCRIALMLVLWACLPMTEAVARTVELDNGDTYDGDLVDGVRTGNGVYTWADGNRYEGEFLDNFLHGQGVYTSILGLSYTGEFVRGQREGEGTLVWENGDRYLGTFKGDHPHGKGVFEWANGDRYEGDYEAGDATIIEGELDSETNPYATGQIIEKNDQFMFGPSIMVAPFYDAHATERSVQLPAGNWYDFYTGELAGNNTRITVTAKQLKDRTPLFVKEGAVIPMFAQAPTNSQTASGQDLIVRHYGKQAGSFELYEDDATTFNYQRGDSRVRTIRIDAEGQIQVHTEGQGPALFGDIVEVQQMTPTR